MKKARYLLIIFSIITTVCLGMQQKQETVIPKSLQELVGSQEHLKYIYYQHVQVLLTQSNKNYGHGYINVENNWQPLGKFQSGNNKNAQAFMEGVFKAQYNEKTPSIHVEMQVLSSVYTQDLKNRDIYIHTVHTPCNDCNGRLKAFAEGTGCTIYLTYTHIYSGGSDQDFWQYRSDVDSFSDEQVQQWNQKLQNCAIVQDASDNKAILNKTTNFTKSKKLYEAKTNPQYIVYTP